MDKEEIWKSFSGNWVFKLYSKLHSKIHLGDIPTAILFSLSPCLVGLLFSLGWAIFSRDYTVVSTYLFNLSPWLHVIGFALALISFGWFRHKLAYVLIHLFEAFKTSKEEYRKIIDKWANCIANRNWIMVVVGIGLFAIPNFFETQAIWTSSQPPIVLEPWTGSSARFFFAVVYGVMHVVIVPFLLGSGTVGLIGTWLLLGDLLKQPLKLAYYRRTEAVIELATWLLMWTLIGLASVLLFGRSIVIYRANIRVLDISGAIQSIVALILAIVVGPLPLIQVRNAIAEAKRSELAHLEGLYERTYSELVSCLGKGRRGSKVQSLYERLETIEILIKKVESVPTLPIRWPSIARVSFGALLSIGSPIIREWLAMRIQLS